MRFLFISNYINHHQIPFCESMLKILGEENFLFLQTRPMEEERVRMGWGVDVQSLPYVHIYDDDRVVVLDAIRDYDMVLLGWTECEEVMNACLRRAESGRPLIRMSERIYREGQWKAISPRGLLAKYREHVRFRNRDVYMLCNGTYTASDFALIHAYPGKMFRWGYFPQLRTYTDEQLRNMKTMDSRNTVRILWAGRFMRGVKHPEFALELARDLKAKGYAFHLDMAGDGEMAEELREYANENLLGDVVTFHGFLPPDVIRQRMEDAHIYLFTSNHLEGWGAVINEAMNSACAVVAGSQAGAVPYLIRDGENGCIFAGEDVDDFISKVENLMDHPGLQRRMGEAAYDTISNLWNSDVAGARLVEFSRSLLDGYTFEAPVDGPMSYAPIIKPFVK